MKPTSSIIIGLFLVFLGQMGICQSSSISGSTIKWSASGFTDLISGEKVDVPCQFITHRDREVEWIQGSGATVYKMKINKTEGKWGNTSEDGTVSFDVALDEFRGKIVLRRSEGQTILLMDLERGGDQMNRLKNEYLITSIETL